MGYFNASFVVGMGCGPLLSGVLYDAFSGMPPLFGRLDAGMVAAFGSMGGLSFLAIIGTLAFMPSSHGTSRHRKRPSFREMGRSPLVRGVFATRVTENIGARPSPPSCRFSPA